MTHPTKPVTLADMQQCEHCEKAFPIETMTMMEDCWFCEACVKEWRAHFDACVHDWRPYTDTMGDEGRICDRCNGFVANEDAKDLGL